MIIQTSEGHGGTLLAHIDVLSHYGRFFGVRHDSVHDSTSWLTWHHTILYAIWLVCVCDMTHSYARHDIHMSLTSRLTWDMTHSHTRHDAFMCATWLTHRSLTSWLMRDQVSRRTNEWVISHIWMNHVTHMNELYHITWMSHIAHTHEWVVSHITVRSRSM